MSTNKAAWLEKCEGEFVAKDSPYHKPGPNEVVIKSAALAINPSSGLGVQGIRAPFPIPNDLAFWKILGTDVAGQVHEVGEGVTSFKKGDRVIGAANWLSTMNTKYSGFQNYVVCPASMTAPIPDTLSYASGSVLPLAVCTSAMGLYPSRRLGLPLPQTTPTPKSALVWGGSSSCGSAAIQLAVASGVTVVATASAKNHTSVRSLGAAAVLDDKSATIAQDLVDVIKKSPGQVAGALGAIGQEATWTVCADVLKALGGGRVVSNSAAESMDAPDGVEVVGATDTVQIGTNPEIVENVWGRSVPEGLKNGALKAVPEPTVVGKGLEKIAEGAAMGLKGVSATKLVVEVE